MSELDINMRDSSRYAVIQRDANMIFNYLRDYIPHNCQRQAMEDLLKAFEQSGLELTDRAKRETYEAVMTLCAEQASYDKILKAGQMNEKF